MTNQPHVVNPEAIGDPDQTPVVVLPDATATPAPDPWAAEYEGRCRTARVRALRYLCGRELVFSAAYIVRVGVDGQISAQGDAGALEGLRRYLGVTGDPVVEDGFARWTHHVGREDYRVEILVIEERSV